MENYTIYFFDPEVWRGVMLIGLLFVSLLVANVLKAIIPALKRSLIPNAVLGGLIVLIISSIWYLNTGDYLFNSNVFSTGGSGINTLETITYHCLAVGFIAMTLRPTGSKLTKKRNIEILDSGVSTIGGYALQAITGIVISIIFATAIAGLAPGSGILMCFGYGQGTGQALNIGKNFDAALGTSSYAGIGLSLAALGFLTASIVGVIYLNYLKRKGRINPLEKQAENHVATQLAGENEVPMNESVDKLSIQVALIAIAYIMAYGIMYLLGNVAFGTGSNMCGTVYGFNFLFGVIAAVLLKAVMNALKKGGVIKHEYTNTYLLNRISGFAFDLMIVSGICAIRIGFIADYILLILTLGVAGAIVTFIYVRMVAKKVFPQYENEQFLTWFGMLTGTASTGMILLREADPNLTTPVSENLVYQNIPAIVLGFPMLIIAGKITGNAASLGTTLSILAVIVVFFLALNIFLFRRSIFKRKAK